MEIAGLRVPSLYAVLAAAGLVCVCAGPLHAQGDFPLLTRAERTDYRETSSYADVMTFVQSAATASTQIHLSTFGYSLEGRALPLVVVTAEGDASPEAIRARGKLRVFVQANIHAGEVCGKEAMQMLLRDLARGRHAEWLDSLVLMIAPIYNADGNERVRLTNRGRQHGPVGGMGQRPNAQGLDLNRDHIKVESPEARSLLALMQRYDPHVFVDLHTTNGTRHGYHLTYAPPLHPNTHQAIVDLLRNDWLPAVTSDIKRKYGWDFYYYGNVGRADDPAQRGWYTFDYRPRFNNNYAGLRNRIAILSEAYSYATFEDRVLASLRFVEEVVGYAHGHASAISHVVAAADRTNIIGEELALTATWERGTQPVDIIMGDVVEERNPYSGRPMLRRTDTQRRDRMDEFGTFQAVESARVPSAYLIPGDLGEVIQKLDEHGVRWERLDQAVTRRVERFVIDSTTVAAREFQGHRVRTVFGSYEVVEQEIPQGTGVVSLEQPLGRLVFSLLEPRSDDGFVTWNLLDEQVDGVRYYPILRVPVP